MNSAIELYDNISVNVEVKEESQGYPVAQELGRRGIYLAAAGSAVVGAWGLICLVGVQGIGRGVSMLIHFLIMRLVMPLMKWNESTVFKLDLLFELTAISF